MQTKRTADAAFALIAAVVGAGFVSGREIMVFFTRFGRMSWLAAGAAATAFGLLTYGVMALYARLETDRFPALCALKWGIRGGRLASCLYAALVAITGGAMAAGLGELAALTLPLHGAYHVGLVLGVCVCALCAWKGLGVLSAFGGAMVPVCGILYGILLRLPGPGPMAAASVQPSASLPLPFGLCYAAMNAALCCGILGELGQGLTSRGRKQVGICAALVLGALLCMANAALLPHAQNLRLAPLPMVLLARDAGPVATWLCIATLFLAMSTTLMTMLRALSQCMCGLGRADRTAAAALVMGLGAVGFNRLVGAAYPLLGWACALVLLGLVGTRRRLCAGAASGSAGDHAA